MSFAAKDGKKFGNAQKQKAYDRSKSDSDPESDSKAIPGGDKVAMPADDGAHGDHSGSGGEESGEDVSSQPIHEVVAAHGPAQHIEIDIEPEGGASIETHHNGKVHKAHMNSMDEADQHVKAATGTEAPMMEEKKPPMMADMGQGGIPGM